MRTISSSLLPTVHGQIDGAKYWTYSFDGVENFNVILNNGNGASVPQSGKAGGQMAHTSTYDALYRLVSATGELFHREK